MSSFLDIESRFGPGITATREVCLVRGEGSWAFDESGRRYLDFSMAHGSVALGHAHPAVASAMKRALEEGILNCGMGFSSPFRARLLERLCQGLGGKFRGFLANSGAEAIETAIKLCALKRPGRKRFVALRRSFHGRTLGASSLTFNPNYKRGLEHLLLEVDFIRPIEEDLDRVDEGVAAVFVEPVQGEGGVYPLPPDFLRALRSRCDEVGSLLVADEVQCGFFRCGSLALSVEDGISPHVVCLAKGMANGIPIGACLWREELGPLPPKVHGTTYGGNPLVCAVALAVLDVVEEERLGERATRMGRGLISLIEEARHPRVKEVRGRGLLVGVELTGPVAEEVVRSLQGKGVLALTTSNRSVVRFMPSLLVSEGELELAASALLSALDEVER